MSERRKHSRVAVSKEVRISGPQGAAYGELQDMSLGGAAILLKSVVAKAGETVEVELPHAEHGQITLAGKVVRVTKIADGDLVGVRFYRTANTLMFEAQRRLDEEQDANVEKRRQYPRVSSRISVGYGHPAELQAMLENISMGGFALTLDAPVELKKEIPIEISHPITKKLIILQGRAVYQNEISFKEKSCFRIGFEFKFLTAEQRQEVAQLLSDLVGLGDASDEETET